MVLKTKWNCTRALLCAAILAGLAATALPARAAATKKYTALGDSLTVGLYSENVANGPYPNGFAAQVRDYVVASRGYDSAAYRNLAVSGATSSNSFSGGDASKGVLENQVAAAVATTPDLVTLTVGGNDVKNYVLAVGAPTNPADINDPKVLAFGNAFQASVRGILTGLRSGVPGSAIFLTNVPKLWLLPAVYDAQIGGFYVFPGATAQDRQVQAQVALSSYITRANTIITGESASANAVVIDLYGNATATDAANVSTLDGFHPNRTGHDALAGLFIDALDNVLPLDSTLIVTTTTDGAPNTDRDLSLREAITFANTSSGVTIRFNLGSDATIRLSSGLVLTSSASIFNAGADAKKVTISPVAAGSTFSLLTVDMTHSGTPVVELNGISLSDNKTNYSSTVTMYMYGGAIFNEGILTINNCTLARNQARRGGAIYNSGTLKLSNVTLDTNHAFEGGGIFQRLGSTTIKNCSFFDNNAAQSGGTIYYERTISIGNSLFAKRISGTGTYASLIIGAGSLTSLGSNLFEGAKPSDFTAVGDASYSDLKIGQLSDNGGLVPTIALLSGSPAFNKGNNVLVPEGITTDARGAGFERIRGSAVDIGAFEQQVVTLPTITVDSPLTSNAVLTALPANLSGTYGDDLGVNGVAQVFGRLSRFNGGVREYWNSTSQVWQSASVKLPVSRRADGTWRSTPNLPRNNSASGGANNLPDGPYNFTAVVVDKSGNTDTSSVSFCVQAESQDTIAPTLTIENPQSNATYSALPASFSGTVNDNNGVFNIKSVVLRLRRFRSTPEGSVTEHWNAQTQTWRTAVTSFQTSPTRPGLASNWQSKAALPSGANLLDGTYCLTAIAHDARNNQGSAWVYFKIVKSAAIAAEASAVQLSSASAMSDGNITLVFTGSLDKSAEKSSRYKVSANATDSEVQSAKLESNGATVVLKVNEVAKGTSLEVVYDTKDSQGRTISGVAKVVAK